MVWSAGAVLTAAQLNTYAPQAWTSYTVNLTGTGTTQGNATVTGGYILYGKTVHFWARAVLGSTSVVGSVVSLSLPFTANSATSGWAGITAGFEDAGTANYLAGVLPATTTVRLTVPGTNGLFAATSSTVPFTWGTGDIMSVGGTYQAA